jgi:hypothetical protein
MAGVIVHPKLFLQNPSRLWARSKLPSPSHRQPDHCPGYRQAVAIAALSTGPSVRALPLEQAFHAMCLITSQPFGNFGARSSQNFGQCWCVLGSSTPRLARVWRRGKPHLARLPCSAEPTADKCSGAIAGFLEACPLPPGKVWVTGGLRDSGYAIRHRLPPGGSGERAGDYIKQGLGLSPLPQGERQCTIYPEFRSSGFCFLVGI